MVASRLVMNILLLLLLLLILLILIILIILIILTPDCLDRDAERLHPGLGPCRVLRQRRDRADAGEDERLQLGRSEHQVRQQRNYLHFIKYFINMLIVDIYHFVSLTIPIRVFRRFTCRLLTCFLLSMVILPLSLSKHQVKYERNKEQFIKYLINSIHLKRFEL